MEKLIELRKQRLMVLPEMKNLNLKHSRNQLNTTEISTLNTLQNQYTAIMRQIYNEEQRLIQEKFGSEMLSEWNNLKELESAPYTTNSDEGQQILHLKNKLAKVQELIDSVRNHIG